MQLNKVGIKLFNCKGEIDMDFTTLLTAENLLSAIAFIAKPLILLIVCKLVISILLKTFRAVFDKSKLDKGIQTFSISALRIIMWLIAIIIVAGAFGIDTASLVTVLGVASLALSLSVQNIFTNVFSGIVILLTKPFKVGDYIDVCGVSGIVSAIEIMRTTITTVDNKVELLPNSDIAASRVTNYSSKDIRRIELKFTASYDNTTEEVKSAIMSVIDSNEKILADKEKFIAINAYNANDIEYVVRFWVTNSDYWTVYFEVNEAVREAYADNNIQFSYPHVVVHQVK